MKFGKSLSNQIEETLPEWRDKFLSYKELKKRLKFIGVGDRQAKRPRLDDDDGSSETAITPEEEGFLGLLEAELEKFNAFFVEKEEEYIIRQKRWATRFYLRLPSGRSDAASAELLDRVGRAESEEELMEVRKEIVDFHGEMILLENYSALNYTGLVKILKKYDKRTGALIRLPFIQKVLQQPFFTTDLLFKLVKECESMLDSLFPKNEQPSVSVEDGEGEGGREVKPSKPGSSLVKGGIPELEEIEYMESLYMKSTIAALRALKEIRSGSSTVSVFSLPPLQSNGQEQRWNEIPVVEQAAK